MSALRARKTVDWRATPYVWNLFGSLGSPCLMLNRAWRRASGAVSRYARFGQAHRKDGATSILISRPNVGGNLPDSSTACNRGVGRVGCFVWSHAGVAFLHGSSYNVSRRGTESVVYSNLIFGNMLVFTARGGLLGRGCAHGGKRPRVTTGYACILPRAHH